MLSLLLALSLHTPTDPPCPSPSTLPVPLSGAAVVPGAAPEEHPPMRPDDLRTEAERSDFQATARHAQVVALLDRLAEASPLVRRGSLGETSEGREIPWITLADPPVADAAAARASGKLVVFVFANIHAGEVCGKEALPMLAREILQEPDAPWARALLDELVLVFAPIYNGDGNERFSTGSRPNQDGPAHGQGQRPNAQGLDLNRDSMKLESPEARAMAAFLTAWDPHLVMDLHTTNGSFHRYQLTYAPPLNPSGHAGPIDFVRDTLLPSVSQRLLQRTGRDTFLYGNFTEVDGDPKGAWTTYSSQPRFGAQYHGLRGHMSILSEAYSHASYETRVLATLEFVRECLLFAAQNADAMRALVERGRAETIAAGEGDVPSMASVGIRHELASASEPAVIRGWVETLDDEGRSVPTDEPQDYVVRHDDHFRPTLSVTRPRGYLIPPGHDEVVDVLRAHGVELASAPMGEQDVEVYSLTAVERAEQAFQGHHIVTADAQARADRRAIDDGWTFVPTAQALGTLAVYLLEPAADDGLVAWGFFDGQPGEGLETGAEFPVLRVP